MRLIDADALIDWIDAGHLRNPSELCFSESTVVDMIDHMPTIEPEQPIHCRDCKHWNSIDGKFGTCEVERWEEGGRYKVYNEEYEDDFCSRAERRTE